MKTRREGGSGGQGRTRTSEGRSRLIYSQVQLPLCHLPTDAREERSLIPILPSRPRHFRELHLHADHSRETHRGEALASPRFHSRQRPTLPRRLHRSTIGPGGLNFRVRNGNGCGPSGITAGNHAQGRLKTRTSGAAAGKVWARRTTPNIRGFLPRTRGADSRTWRSDHISSDPEHIFNLPSQAPVLTTGVAARSGSVELLPRKDQALVRLVPVGSTR